MHRLPFPVSSFVSLAPLHLIHVDVWGHAPEASINGYKYYVSFIDDYSKYTWFYPLSLKSGVFIVF